MHYASVMKRKIFRIILTILSLIGLDPGSGMAFAEETSAEASEQGEELALSDASAEELRFFAVNAGYKDNEATSSQNYDFFVLEKTTEDALVLGGYKVVYSNSSGNEAGSVIFDAAEELQSQYLVLGFSKSPQYQNKNEDYLYNFGSSGLASTGGKLSLYKDDELIEDICWGKLECKYQIPKFSATEEGNYSAVLRDGEFVQEKYYPEIDESAIAWREVEKTYCANLEITEIYSYFEESASEQFVEIHNLGETCSLEGLNIGYKTKTFALQGSIATGDYYAFYDDGLVLTKNPTTSNSLSIVSDDGEKLDEVSYPHGQKAGLSYSLVDGQWVLSYARTPGVANIYQEFQSCPEGKVINEATSNCVNEETESTTVCPEGKVLNPETGRCKKIEEEAGLAECAEGYERNPETNRCRKIQESDGSEYAPKTSATTSYDEPQRFVAYGALALAILAGIIYVAVQYREELAKVFRTIISKIKRPFGSLGTKRRLALLDKI